MNVTNPNDLTIASDPLLGTQLPGADGKPPVEVVFIESDVKDIGVLLAGIDPSKEVHVLDASKDGLQQMADILQGRTGIGALHIVSHGAEGEASLGSLLLDSGTAAGHAAELQAIGQSLDKGADILLYGCDAGAGASGTALVDQLAIQTGADVAASNNLTGAASLGGDWNLEVHSGNIEAQPLVDAQLAAAYHDTLALGSVTVNFGTQGNFVSYGSYIAGAASDVTYKVSGDAGYVLKVDSADAPAYSFGGTTGYVTVYGGSLITLSFTGGNVFTATSLDFTNFDSTNSETEVFKGYDASNNLVATTSAATAAQATSTVSLTGFTNITHLKITALGGAFSSMGESVDNIAFSSIAAVDTTPPTVTDVTSSTANGTYKIGDTIAVQVNFSENVNVTGTPQLTLETGTTDRVVNYASGNGTSTLTFNYTVQAGDTSADLDYLNTSALALNGGTIKDLAGNAGTLTLASPGAANSLGANSNIVVDGVAPTITFSGLAFSSDTGTSSSDFITNVSAQTITATLSGALGTGDIVYGSLDNGSTWSDITADVSGTTLSWTGVTLASSSTLKLKVTDSAGNDGTVANQAYVLDTSAPATTVATIAFSADTGASSTDFITNTAAQTISGTLSANVAAGEIVQVSIDNGSTWNTAAATVGQNTWSISTTLSASDTLQVRVSDAAGNNGTAASQAYVLDTVAPTTTIATMAFSADTGTSSTDFITNTAAQTISGTTSANIAAGETVEVSTDNGTTWSAATAAVGQSTWSISTTLTGSDTLKVRVADTAGNNGTAASQAYVLDTTAPSTTVSSASFSADSGTSSTDFVTHTAAQTISGTLSANLAAGETVQVSIDNGATWSDAAATVGQNTWSLSTTLTASNTLKVQVSDSAGNPGTTYSQAFVLDTSAPSAPSAPDMTAGTDTGSSGSDDNTSNTTPTFTGTAESGSTVTLYDTDGSTMLGTATATGGAWSITSSSLSEGSHSLTATATDTAGNVSSASSSLSVTIDTTAPDVSSVSVPGNGAYKAGDNLDFTVNLSEAVTVDTTGGTPTIALTVGSTTDYASYLSGSGTSSLVFRYTVQAGDTDTDGVTVGALQANGGTLADAAGNNATLTLNSVGSTAGVLVDTTAPTVTDAHIGIGGASGTSGAFKIGDIVTATWDNSGTGDNNGDISGVTADFSAFGGGSAVAATNSSGTWTATYTIASGSIDATNQNVSFTATDTAGNTTTTADTTNATVDNVAPTVTDANIGITGASGNGGAFKVGDTVTATWDNTGSGDNNSDTMSSVTVDFSQFGGGSAVAATNSSGTWTATYTITAGSINDVTNRNVAFTVTDNAGNTTTTADGTNAEVDNVVPTISGVSTTTANGDYHTGDTIAITVAFSDAVTVAGTPQLTLETGTTDHVASYASGSGTGTLTFDYTVQSGDTSTDLDYLSSTALALNGGSIDDAAGNAASLTLATPGATGSLGANADIQINVNHAPTGSVVIAGTAAVGQVVTADTSTLADVDGLGTLSYQWLSGSTPVGTNSSSYTITSADISAPLTVQVSYVDGFGTSESVLSSPVSPATTPTATSGNDVLVGGIGDDVLDGGKGADTMIGGAGNDTYYVDNRRDAVIENSGEGSDTVDATRSYALPDDVENLVLGGTGHINAVGNALDNDITGNSAGNRITGGLGADTLTGGAGADRFIWTSVADSPAGVGTYDVITDFNAAEGDRVDLHMIDADVASAGKQHFHFIGTAAFSSTDATGELRFDPSTHMLYGSVNADANPEFAVQLTGVTTLSASAIHL